MAAGAASRSGPLGRHGVYGGPVEVIPLRPHRSRWIQALIFLARWSIELTLLVALWVAVDRLHDQTGWTHALSLAVVVGVLVVPMTIRPVRRVTVRAVWVAITRHRLRVFFVQCRIYNRSGRLPWIVLARPTPVGERAWIWLVPGLSVADFEDATEQITAACWARTARVERHRALGSLVIVDVVRRDPLTGTQPLLSTLLARLRREDSRPDPAPVIDLRDPRPHPAPHPTPDGVPSRSRAPDRGSGPVSPAASGPGPRPAQEPSTGSRTRPAAGGKTSSARGGQQPVVRGPGGEDVSDYV